MENRIDSLFCFAVIDSDGNEGVPAIKLIDSIMPLMGADMDLVESLKEIAKRFEKETDQKVRLYKFSNKEELPW